MDSVTYRVYEDGKYYEWQFTYPTVTIAATPVLSGVGHRKLRYTHYVLTVRSYIFATTEEELWKRIQEAEKVLKKNRGRFEYVDPSGGEIFTAGPDEDIGWGPVVTHLAIERFWANKAALITWQLETDRKEEEREYDLVYTVSTDIDASGFATRTVTGTLRIWTQPGDKVKDADEWRRVAYESCPIPKGWRRIRQSYRMGEDGTTLAFVLVDRHESYPLPEGFSDGNVTISVSMQGETLRGTIPDVPGEISIDGYLRLAADTILQREYKIGDLLGWIPKKVMAGYPADTGVSKSVYLLRANVSFSVHDHTLRFGFRFGLTSAALKEKLGELKYASALEETEFVFNEVARCARRYILELRKRADKGVVGYYYGGPIGWCKAAPDLINEGKKAGRGQGEWRKEGGAPGGKEEKEKEVDIVSWKVCHWYREDRRVVVIPCVGGGAVTQKVGEPILYLFVEGEAVGTKEHPKLFDLPYAEQDADKEAEAEGAVILEKEVKYHSPTPAGYRTEWKYKILVRKPSGLYAPTEMKKYAKH